MRFVTLLKLLTLAISSAANALPSFMPADHDYDPGIPTPESVLGYEVGEWHVRHDQLVRYMERVAEASPRVQIEVTGRTHEQRPLLLLTITDPGNHREIDSLRQQHLDHAFAETPDSGPLVLWFGYSIHGNEASGSNAALLMAYHLAASRNPQLEAHLKDTVILLDPSLNPDGLSRFAHWANTNRSVNLVANRDNREHNEVWPGGRFNHYWFDLNRDWLLLTHPESRARVKVLQRWQPNVITDFHEMGSDSTYFFQPGVPERQNPLTPQRNFELTAALAAYHAEAFDKLGQLYYSKEQFDDFYYGKGSTYPDIQGMIGILFEQASARGHLMATDNGPLAFETAIRNQFTASLSTLAGATDLSDDLKSYQREFHRQSAREAQKASDYLFGDRHDPGRAQAMADILIQHGIEVYELGANYQHDGQTFQPGSAYVVPGRQRQHRLIEAMFERRTSFEDSTFYDVSAWTFPLAFDLPVTELSRSTDLRGEQYGGVHRAAPAPTDGAYAYAIEWRHYRAPRSLQRLLDQGIRPRVATRPFSTRTERGEYNFQRGTIVVPAGPPVDRPSLMAVLAKIADDDGVPVFALRSGLSRSGPDLGSPSLRPIEPIRPLIVTGRGVSATEVGEVWHLMDTRIGLAPVMVEKSRLDEVDLSDYSHVLMVNGGGDLDEALSARVAAWVSAGGVLVAIRDAAAWATRTLIKPPAAEGEGRSAEDTGDAAEPAKQPVDRRPYADFDDDYSQTVIGGAIVRGSVDVTHPLAYGYLRDTLPLIRRGSTSLAVSDNPYETVIRYADDLLIAGYMGEERQSQLAGSGALLASRMGRGAVIRMADNPNFRGVWYGTNRLFFNALYMAQLLDRTELPDTEIRL